MTTYLFDYAERAIAALVYRLRKPRLVALVEAFAEELQVIEDTAFALVEERFLDTADGAQLDQLAAVLDATRDGLSDEDLRARLRVRILANRSRGEGDRLLRIVALSTARGPVWLRPVFPAGLRIEFPSPPGSPLSATRARIAREELGRAVASGVQVDELVEWTDGGVFGFEDDPDALGFDDGELAEDVFHT